MQMLNGGQRQSRPLRYTRLNRRSRSVSESIAGQNNNPRMTLGMKSAGNHGDQSRSALAAEDIAGALVGPCVTQLQWATLKHQAEVHTFTLNV